MAKLILFIAFFLLLFFSGCKTTKYKRSALKQFLLDQYDKGIINDFDTIKIGKHQYVIWSES